MTTEVAGATLIGIGYGAVSPAVNTVLGFHAPDSIKATIFGPAGSAFAAGSGLGPILCGLIAAAFDPQASLAFSVLLALAVAVLILRGVNDGPAVREGLAAQPG